MLYDLTASGTFTRSVAPHEPVDRSGTYRVHSLFPIGASLAAQQLFLADCARAGFAPAGPVEVSEPAASG
jgi:hypothetical protein